MADVVVVDQNPDQAAVDQPADTVVYVPRTVEMPKELDDARALLVSVITDVKDGKSTTAILSGNFAKAIAALEGIKDIGAEVRSQHFIDFAALTLADIVKIFVPQIG